MLLDRSAEYASLAALQAVPGLTLESHPLDAPSDVLDGRGRHLHGPADVVLGYSVVRTDWSAGMWPGQLVRHEVARYGPAEYLTALAHARTYRTGAAPIYGLVEALYNCGCREGALTGSDVV